MLNNGGPAIERAPKISNTVKVDDVETRELLETFIKELRLLNERFEEAFDTQISKEDI